MSGGRFSLSHSSTAERAWWPAVAVLALAGAGLVLLSTAKYGAGISPDSVSYFDVARNLVVGRGFVFHTGQPLVWWPPLYPALLALVGLVTGADPNSFAHVVNAVLFALVVCLSARLIRGGLRQSGAYGILGVGAVLMSGTMSEIYPMAWSENLFIPLVLLYLVAAERYWQTGRARYLAAMAVWVGLACLTRYIGIALIPIAGLTVVLAPGVSLKRRLVRSAASMAMASLPVCIWLARNHFMAGTFIGRRFPQAFTYVDNVVPATETLLSWYTFGTIPAIVLPILVLVVAVLALLVKVVRTRLLTSFRMALLDYPALVIFLVLFALALLATATRDMVIVDSRLLSPLYVPVTLLVLKFCYHLLAPTRERSPALAARLPAVFLVLWLPLSLAYLLHFTVRRSSQGAGEYSTPVWRESEILRWARDAQALDGPDSVYSNGSDVLWEFARTNAIEVPKRRDVDIVELDGRWPRQEHAFLVWFSRIDWRRHLYTVEELAQVADMEEVRRFEDGAVYRVSRRKPTAPGDLQSQSP